eukprot:2063305-Amphidinium_carterae.1
MAFISTYALIGSSMVAEDLLSRLAAAFQSSGYAEETFMSYQGGNPTAVRQEIIQHLTTAS